MYYITNNIYVFFSSDYFASEQGATRQIVYVI